MVREVRQPSLITPQRPRVSSSATTTATRDLPASFPYPSTTKGPRAPAIGAVKKRQPLGERTDNALVPESQPIAASMRVDTVKKGRSSLGPPSRSTPRAKSLSMTNLSVLTSIKPRPNADSSRPSPRCPPPVDENDTLLLDTRPPEMAVFSDTDESGDEIPGPSKPSARWLTPADSQEVKAVCLHRFVHPPSSSHCHAISQLRTPPSSQSQSDHEPSTSHPTASCTRPRPSPSPACRTSIAPSVLLSECQGASPNPRRKKSPRVDQTASLPESPRLRSPFEPQDRMEVVITSGGHGRGKPRTPSATLSRTSSPRISASQLNSHSSTFRTPFSAQQHRSIPSSAPAATRRSRISNTKHLAPPKTLQSNPLSRQQTPVSSFQSRRSLTPSAMKTLSALSVGFHEEAVEASPGDDPLLLKALETEALGRKLMVDSWKAELRHEGQAIPVNALASSSRLSPRDGKPQAVTSDDQDQTDQAEVEHEYHDIQNWASDDDSVLADGNGVQDDTFLHILSRCAAVPASRSPGAGPSRATSRSASPLGATDCLRPEPALPSAAVSTPTCANSGRLALVLTEARAGLVAAPQELADPDDGEEESSKLLIPDIERLEVDDQVTLHEAEDESVHTSTSSLRGEEHEADIASGAEDGDWKVLASERKIRPESPEGVSQHSFEDLLPKILESPSQPEIETVSSLDIVTSHLDSIAVGKQCAAEVPQSSSFDAPSQKKQDEQVTEQPSKQTEEDEKIARPVHLEDEAGDITAEAESGDWSLSEPGDERRTDFPASGMNRSSNRETSPASVGEEAESHDEHASAESDQEDDPSPGENGEKIVIRVISRGVVKLEDERAAESPGACDLSGHAIAEIRGSSPRSASLYPSVSGIPKVFTLHVGGRQPPLTSTGPCSHTSTYRYSNAPALEAMLPRRTSSGPGSVHVPSRLSQETTLVAEASRKSRPTRTLQDELSSATANDGDEQGDESIQSVVEVSSLDPRAAARAAAILKLNHAYIEHGVLPTSTPDTVSKPLPSDTPRHRKSRTFDSPHFANIPSTRKLGKDELLHEAELEIVASGRSRSRSFCQTESGSESVESEMVLPGGWKRTPGKRKRRERPPTQSTGTAGSKALKGMTGKAWGVKDWKRLEKVYKAERADWVERREVRRLPPPSSRFLGWMRAGKLPEAQAWDAQRVVVRFLNEQAVEGDLSGEWDREVIELRVDALERRAAMPTVKAHAAEEDERCPKKARTDVARYATVVQPPSTIRKMLGYVLPGLATLTPVVDHSLNNSVGERERPAVSTNNKLLSKLREVQASEPDPPSMKQVASLPATAAILKRPLAHPSVSTWNPPLPVMPSASTSFDPTPPLPGISRAGPSLLAQTRRSTLPPPAVPIPSMPMSMPAPPSTHGSQSVSVTTSNLPSLTNYIFTRPLDRPLNPPLALRSSAIAMLFPDSPCSTTSTAKSTPPAPISIPSRGGGRESPRVKDLVRSFEDAGVLKGSLENQRDGLRRSRSSAGLKYLS